MMYHLVQCLSMFNDTKDRYANVMVESYSHLSLSDFTIDKFVELIPGDCLSTVTTHSVNDVL